MDDLKKELRRINKIRAMGAGYNPARKFDALFRHHWDNGRNIANLSRHGFGKNPVRFSF